MKRTLLTLTLLASGCAANTQQNGLYRHGNDNVEEVVGPKSDRCSAYKDAQTTFQQCQEFKQAATNYLHGLNTGDDICVENGFGDAPTEACKARAFLIDADNHGFLVEIRYPKLDSKWKTKNQQKIYFHNEALIDLFLREKGYE